MKNPQAIWDARYTVPEKKSINANYDDWLVRWKPLLPSGKGQSVLDMGCGIGLDTRYLADLGLTVFSLDFSWEALNHCRKRVFSANPIQVDFARGLPFVANCFDAVVANLSLHYFNDVQTLSIVQEIRRCLKSGCALFVRVNSVKDSNFGADGFEEIEPGVYSVYGQQKRFFDGDTINGLYGFGWEIISMEEMQVDRFSKPKMVWEVILRNVSKTV